MQYAIRMTWYVTQCHPDDLTPGGISCRWLFQPDHLRSCPMSSEWHDEIWTLCGPDDLAPGGVSSVSLMANRACHPDDLPCYPKSPGWHNEIWTLCHPNDLTLDLWLSYSDYLWRIQYVIQMTYDATPKSTYASTLRSSRWNSNFQIFTTCGGPSVLPH